ncbi:ABC transporter ATP-binding protein [Rubrobacter indicoceani]|uniref:ABC transporter ATP-binding protein n=1 Tax=Rubrobacter indicoceani TaxID=2051957 RepID=UPI000E5AF83B|nr:ABC transporter ATP-binding protein [Rubrobacter indicoceani]
MLVLSGVNAHYGSSHILQGVDLRVDRGEVVALLGRNGVGKTTTVRTVMGILPASGGTVTFKGSEVTKHPSHKRARLGMGLVPQGRGVYPNLSVEEQLDLPPKRRSGDPEWSREAVYELFPRLAERKKNSGGQLSGGEQQMLSMARALCGEPELLLLDEPSEGLAPLVVEQVGEVLRDIRRRELSILLVEQNLNLALSVADRVYIMNKGRIVHEAGAEELSGDRETQHRLLGV